MDFLPSSQSTAAVTSISAFVIFVFSLFFISTKVIRNRRRKKTPTPEVGGAWPVIGHLHLLGGEETAHRLFSKIVDKYGPIFTVKVGVHPTLVVAGYWGRPEINEKTDKNLDIVVQGWLDEHKKKKASGETKEDEDFMDVMISILQDDPQLFPGRDADYANKATCLNYEYMSFSSGRRMCPGGSFALQVLQLTLASLIHGFDLETQSNEPIDTSEGIGLTFVKASPLEVLVSPASAAFSFSICLI
ncbi:hypothetical protein EZV62_021479 [Acer yangbiense]|uniref:Cytochrome P450 n=1 Tax=Acer yangbiense TaxID=1000413 RepID=A0A5C7H5R9_9ROSI|nr:hypothetical protein EZV62_021479 [Acer yangbiense]